jgi:hypothetical protein
MYVCIGERGLMFGPVASHVLDDVQTRVLSQFTCLASTCFTSTKVQKLTTQHPLRRVLLDSRAPLQEATRQVPTYVPVKQVNWVVNRVTA